MLHRFLAFVHDDTDNWIIDKPQDDPNIRGDAFKTLMVSRLSYQATEEDLEREFGRIGAIERVCLLIQIEYSRETTNSFSDSHCEGYPRRRKAQQKEESTSRLCLYRV